MKKVLVFSFLFILLVGGLVSATFSIGSNIITPNTEFQLGELECEQVLLYKGKGSGTETIIFEDMDSGEEITFDYSLGEVTPSYSGTPARGSFNEESKKITVTFNGVNYDIYVSTGSTKIFIPERFGLCLSDSRYVSKGNSFDLGKNDCKQTFLFEDWYSDFVSVNEIDIIWNGIKLKETTIPSLTQGPKTSFWNNNKDSNPLWSSDVYEYYIENSNGDRHTIYSVFNEELIFIKDEFTDECFMECIWDCEAWGSCVDGEQIRRCFDSNNCGTEDDKPGETRTCVGEPEDEESEPEFPDNSCDDIGIRANGEYCSLEKLWETQKTSETVCENNFECDSNLCSKRSCQSISEEPKSESNNLVWWVLGIIGVIVVIGIIVGVIIISMNSNRESI